jgi:uncharacterized RDD family membrane protein YckC
MSSPNPNPYAPPKAPVADHEDLATAALATRGQRAWAATWDSLISILWVIPLTIGFGLWDLSVLEQGISARVGILLAVLSFVSFALVNAYFLKRNGQTLGKKFVGIRIATLDDQVPDLWRVIVLRYGSIWLISFIPVVGGLLNLIDVLFIFRADRRCVHDHIAATKVVRVSA